MPLTDIVKAAIAKPAGRVMDAPVREIVEEVLRDHGFVGPAEVHRLKEEIAKLSDRVLALEAKLTGSEPPSQLEARARALEEAAARMEAETSRIVRVVERALAERDVRVGDSAAVGCRVVGCEAAHERAGFCATHHAAWRSGALEGYVGPEGLLAAGSEAWRVDRSLAGQPFTIVGKGKARGVAVNGAPVTATKI
jgi:hypothetical protein